MTTTNATSILVRNVCKVRARTYSQTHHAHTHTHARAHSADIFSILLITTSLRIWTYVTQKKPQHISLAAVENLKQCMPNNCHTNVRNTNGILRSAKLTQHTVHCAIEIAYIYVYCVDEEIKKPRIVQLQTQQKSETQQNTGATPAIASQHIHSTVCFDLFQFI